MRRPRLVVIGGSAGALEPLMQILTALPATVNMPIAVVLHLQPTQPSLLPELLARGSGRRVGEAEDKAPLERGAVYIAPPNYHMLIERRGTIALSVDEPVNFSRPSIDLLFESAADACGPRTIGLVLSGANSDGAIGLRQIAARGGFALVQDPATAAYPAMPVAAQRLVPSARALGPGEVSDFFARLTGAHAHVEQP